MGNIFKEDFFTVWNSKPFPTIIARHFPVIPGFRFLDDGESLAAGDRVFNAFNGFQDLCDVMHLDLGSTVHYPANLTRRPYGMDCNFIKSAVFARPILKEPTKSEEQPFWTITSKNCEHTNSRSQRYLSEAAAVEAATSRIDSGQANDGVYVLKSVKLVRPVKPVTSVVVEDL